MHFGSIAPPPPVQYACSVHPSSVFPGEQVTVTGTAANLDPKKKQTYSWSGQGLTVAGTTSTTTVDTASLQPGAYTVSGHVAEGPKAGQSADCTAQFTDQASSSRRPCSCIANPSTVKPGEQLHHHLHRREPAEPSADLQLLGFLRIHQRKRATRRRCPPNGEPPPEP